MLSKKNTKTPVGEREGGQSHEFFHCTATENSITYLYSKWSSFLNPTWKYMHAHRHIHTYEYMHVCPHTRIFACARTRARAHTHTHTQTHTHTNTHTYHTHTDTLHKHTRTHTTHICPRSDVIQTQQSFLKGVNSTAKHKLDCSVLCEVEVMLLAAVVLLPCQYSGHQRRSYDLYLLIL